MLSYEIDVEDVEIDGHPISVYASNLDVAARHYETLVKKYPHNKVILTELGVKAIKESVPLKRVLECPRGCKGVVNGREVVQLGSKDNMYCTICGWREA